MVQERLEREFDLDLIATAPSVVYRLHMNDGTVKELHNPADMPDVVKNAKIEEPWIKAPIFVPDEYLGAIMKLFEARRGQQQELTSDGARARVAHRLSLDRGVFEPYTRD